MIIVGFAHTSMVDVAEMSRKWLRRRRRKIGPLLCISAEPDRWRRKPPGILLSSWLDTVLALDGLGEEPELVGIFDGWVRMQRCELDVVDAVPLDSDPMASEPLPFGYDDLAELMASDMPRPRYKRPMGTLADDMLAEVDGSVTQTLLKITNAQDTEGGRTRSRDAYVDWLLFGGSAKSLTSSLGAAGVDGAIVGESLEWLKSDKGREAVRVCRRMGRKLSAGSKIDYAEMVHGTRVAPFDLRYLAFHARS